MSNYDDEQKAMDAAIHDEDSGRVFQTVGWTMMGICTITSVWIFVGWRAGSWFWFWITLGLGIVATGFITAGALLRSRAAKDFAAAGVAIRSRALPTPESEKLPPWDDVEHRTA